VDTVDVDDLDALIVSGDLKTIVKRIDGIGPKIAARLVEKWKVE